MANGSLGLLLALLAGMLSYASTYLPDSIGVRWGAGVLFGLMVLAPTQRDIGRRVALVAISTIAYRAAVWIAQELHTEVGWPVVASCALAGVFGVLVVSLGTSALLRARADLRAIALASIAGVISGVLIGLCVEAEDESLGQQALLLGGYVVWQMGYTAAHRLTPQARGAAG
ncbi:MAG: hypothetical protein H6R20_1312 [Proteobacteria bacterium]|jgi:hypothetical protein|nr:hypothetical protein [Pseudomonadota bacterium]